MSLLYAISRPSAAALHTSQVLSRERYALKRVARLLVQLSTVNIILAVVWRKSTGMHATNGGNSMLDM